MTRIVTSVVSMVMLCATVVCAEDTLCVIEKEPKAKTPVGAVVECAGVFVGKIASACEIAATGQRQITVENQTGECRVFPFCTTTKIADKTFGAATFDSLKPGKPVEVTYVEEGGTPTAESVTVAE